MYNQILSVTSHAHYPSLCHQLLHILGPSPLSSVAYFMDGPHAMAFKGAKQIGALTSGERGQLLLWS